MLPMWLQPQEWVKFFSCLL